MKISDRSAGIIQDLGAVLLVLGAVLLGWVGGRFHEMPNYLRLAVLLPVGFGIPMSVVECYRNLASQRPRDRGWLVASLIIPFMLLAGVVFWFLADPSAKG